MIKVKRLQKTWNILFFNALWMCETTGGGHFLVWKPVWRFFNISLVLHLRMKVIWVWNRMRVNKCPGCHLIYVICHRISMQTVEKVRELSLNDQIFSADSRPSTIAISSHYTLAYARFNYKSLTLLLLFQIASVIWQKRSHAQTRWSSGVN